MFPILSLITRSRARSSATAATSLTTQKHPLGAFLIAQGHNKQTSQLADLHSIHLILASSSELWTPSFKVFWCDSTKKSNSRFSTACRILEPLHQPANYFFKWTKFWL